MQRYQEASLKFDLKNACPMRLTKEDLLIRVVVRRAKRGPAPFVWEINSEDMIGPLYVSPDAFETMEDAYRAGQAKLPNFLPLPKSIPPVPEHRA